MNYKEKFLKIFSLFIRDRDKSKTHPSKLNGKYVSYHDSNRIEEWFKDGQLHREDGPASITKTSKTHVSIEKWYVNGQLHRENGPAIKYENGKKEWYKNGELHREDGPAVEDAFHVWYKDGKRHRIGGPALYTPEGSYHNNPRQEWWENGKLHRVDGPAIIDGNGKYQEWRLNGLRHRTDGPAITEDRGNKFHLEWWINSNELTFEAFGKFLLYQELQKGVSSPFDRPGKKPKI
jgi:hypothetical protein